MDDYLLNALITLAVVCIAVPDSFLFKTWADAELCGIFMGAAIHS